MFLTGGTGLVGSHVAELLRASGLQVRALHRADSDTRHLKALGCELVEGSLEDGKVLWNQVLDECEGLVHAAALVFERVSWARLHEVNVAATQRLLAAAGSTGIGRVVHISSVAVYGAQEGSIDERLGRDASLARSELYARSKWESEQAAREGVKGKGVSLVILRPAALYGERDRWVVPAVLRGLDLPVQPLLGGGNTPLALVYAGNLAQAVLAALHGRLEPGTHTYNAADDHPITLRSLLSTLSVHLEVSFRPISVPRGLALSLATLGDMARVKTPGLGGLSLRRAVRLMIRPNPYRSVRIREELGWRPVFSLDESLRRTARWILSTRSGNN